MNICGSAVRLWCFALLAFASVARAQCPPEWIAPPLPDSAPPAIVGEILCSVVWNNTLVVGGTFTSIGGGQFNHIAQWDGTAWRLVGPFSGINGDVRALAVDWNNNLIAGGTFTIAGGVAANRIARFNGTNWSAIGAGITSAGGVVNAIERVSFQGTENLYVGGSFADAGGIASVNNIVRIDTANAYSVVGTPAFHGTEGEVFAIHYRTHVWVGGTFSGVRLSNGILTSPRMARWSVLANAWGNAPVLQGMGVYSISSGAVNSLSAIIIGGDFLIGASTIPDQLAYLDVAGAGLSWGFLPRLNGAVRAVKFPYVVGDFTATSSGATALSHIALWSGSENRLKPLGTGIDGRANTLTTLNSAQFVGGAFDNASGSPSPRIAQWDGQTWSRLRPRPSGPVNALYPLGTTLYVGGSFDQSVGSGESAHNVFTVSSAGFGRLETLTGFNGTNGAVNALCCKTAAPRSAT